MAKTNGRTARPKKSAEMSIGGPLDVQLTKGTLEDLLNGSQVTINTGNAMEFYLALKTGDKDAVVNFSPWFDASNCQVKIENSVAIDGEFADAIEVILRDREDRSVGLELNVEQAEKLAGILQLYTQARRGYEALKADQPTT